VLADAGVVCARTSSMISHSYRSGDASDAMRAATSSLFGAVLLRCNVPPSVAGALAACVELRSPVLDVKVRP
jgi:hypothetical protein